ncbi:unnamed protein product, partial [Mesorhabditis belari]|uniref:DM2 domain-containing protein n=1 Tax=Mesorhabditis belari TaxID=2138241 RepID=A0AAF3E8C1_9BILA
MEVLPIPRDDIKEAIDDVIKERGLDVITSTIIRNYLKEKFDKDFTSFKKQIDEITREQIEKVMAKNKANKEQSDSEKDNGNQSGSSLSDSDVEDKAPPTKAPEVKATKERRRKVTPDVDSDDDLMTKVKRRRGAQTTTTRKTKSKAPRKAGNSAFSRVFYCTEDLQAITGKPYMRRCDVVKSMWKYIDANNLKNPKNKRMINCDENLKKIFKKANFLGFGMMSVLTNHILDPNELGGDHVELANEAKKLLIEELNKDIINDNADGEFVNKGKDGDASDSD